MIECTEWTACVEWIMCAEWIVRAEWTACAEWTVCIEWIERAENISVNRTWSHGENVRGSCLICEKQCAGSVSILVEILVKKF